MKRILLTASLLPSLAFTAAADNVEPKIAAICQPAVRSPQSRVQPRVLLGYLLRGVDDIDLDKSGGDVSYPRKVEAVLAGAGYCDSKGANCSDDPKARKSVASKLEAANTALADFVQRHSGPIDTSAGGYRFAFVVSTANLRAFLLDSNGMRPTMCVAGTAPPPSVEPPAGPQDKSRFRARLLVRNSVDDLSIDQNNPAFKGLKRASFSIDSDRLQSSTTYNIQGVVGLGIGQTPLSFLPSGYGEFFPYLSYTRQFVEGNNPKNISNVDNVGVGIVGNVLFSAIGLQNDFLLTRGMYNDFQFSSQLVHSNRSNTDVLTGKITYTPYPALPGVSTTAQFGDFEVMILTQGTFIYGDVLNTSANSVLGRTGTFQRAGGRADFSATATTGILEGFGVHVSYDYLKSLGGDPVSNIALFTAALSYTLPKQQYWNIQLKYTDGRNLDTLEQQRLITLGVGLKY